MEENFTILIVDDNTFLQNKMVSTIEKHIKTKIRIANNGMEAIRILGNNDIDLVLMDVYMPKLSGFDTAKAMKANIKKRNTPIIFITGRDPQKELEEQGFDLGAIDYLTKPFDDIELIRLVKLYLRFIGREKEINRELVQNNQKLETEIMERKAAEISLQKSEKQLAAQYEGIPVPTYTWQKTGDTFYLENFNKAAYELTGGVIKNYIGTKLEELYKNQPDIIDHIKTCYNEKRSFRLEMRYKMKSTNKIIYLDVKYAYIPDQFVLVHTEDISERVEAQQRLKESEDKFRNMSSSANDALILIDDHGKVNFWNNAAEKIFGYSKDEAMNKNVHGLIAPKKYKEDYTNGFNAFRKTGKGKLLNNTYEFDGLRKNGVVFPVELSLAAIKIKDKWNAIGLVRDISERKEAERKVIESEKRLKEANATKNKFFSIVAHDLRNPLGSFREVTKMMSESYDSFSDDEKKEFIELMKDSSKNIYNLLENLLVWSRSQRGTLQFNPDTIDACYIANEMINLGKMTASKKKIEIANEIPEATKIYADPNMITTVIRNLTGNAIKFTPENGKITILSEQNGDWQLITVKDTGIGISEENSKKLFRIDEQHSTPGTNDEGGTGLGLILCKEFVEKHKGNIWVESREGKGSEFKFTLPVSEEIYNKA